MTKNVFYKVKTYIFKENFNKSFLFRKVEEAYPPKKTGYAPSKGLFYKNIISSPGNESWRTVLCKGQVMSGSKINAYYKKKVFHQCLFFIL